MTITKWPHSSAKSRAQSAPRSDSGKMPTHETRTLGAPLGALHESNLHKIRPPLDDISSGDPTRKDEHASEADGSPYVRPLLPRIFLATAGCRWPVLSGVPAVRRRIQL